LLLAALPAAAKEKKIRGYVTAVHSPTSFEIEDHRITRDATLALELEAGEFDEKGDFRADDIRVGTLVEVVGEADAASGEFRAKSLKVILDEYGKIERTALIEWTPALERTADGWQGTFFADGQWIVVDSGTKVLFKPNKAERKALEKQKKQARVRPAGKEAGGDEDEDDGGPAVTLDSLQQVGPNTFLTYEGVRRPDYKIQARRVEFTHNELEKAERNLWGAVGVTRYKPPDFERRKAGELEIANVGKFKVVPDAHGQRYVQWLGQRLIPPHQKSLPKEHPDRIPFFFFLVEGKEANAFALPNGLVVIYSAMFDVLENEAQLATVMAHEIAHAIQEHSWRQQNYHRKKLMAMRIGGLAASVLGGGNLAGAVTTLIEGAVRSGYSRSLENQADRAGLEYMLAAGYDIREAPRVWQQMAKAYGDRPTNLFWSSHDNHTTRRSYLMAELRMNYAETNYSKLITNQEQYAEYTERVRQASVPKDKKKK
jgi:hypothetical protein